MIEVIHWNKVSRGYAVNPPATGTVVCARLDDGTIKATRIRVRGWLGVNVTHWCDPQDRALTTGISEQNDG